MSECLFPKCSGNCSGWPADLVLSGGLLFGPPFRFCSGDLKNERKLSNIYPLTTSSTGVYDITGFEVGAKTSEGVHSTVLASSRKAL